MTFSENEFIRTLNLDHLTMYRRFISDILRERADGTLFLIDEEKLIFCGPDIDDGCKTT